MAKSGDKSGHQTRPRGGAADGSDSRTARPREDHPGAGHRGRLRDKFLAFGLEKFTDEEVLELLLTLATPRQDCKQQARALMKNFGNLRRVFEADREELARIKGIGPKNALGIKLIHQVARRYLRERLIHGEALSSSSQAFEFLNLTMRDLKREVFRVIFLTNKNRVITTEDVFSGTLTRSAVYPREVVSRALHHGAAKLIIAHNHPAGDPRPSADDLNLTRQLVMACGTVDIGVMDHLIIGDNQYYSLADQGHLKNFRQEAERVFNPGRGD
ncbi:MAG: DNA repair protein RadC [Proteobacteria bacterium]|nr:DNA repair protein RadC [Pseudomonadota bacterium]